MGEQLFRLIAAELVKIIATRLVSPLVTGVGEWLKERITKLLDKLRKKR